MEKEEKAKYVIDIISDKVKEIFEEKFKDDIGRKPTFFISEMMMFNEENKKCGIKYILTLIHSPLDYAFDYRQSDFIDMHTDLEKTIEHLYNRTM